MKKLFCLAVFAFIASLVITPAGTHWRSCAKARHASAERHLHAAERTECVITNIIAATIIDNDEEMRFVKYFKPKNKDAYFHELLSIVRHDNVWKVELPPELEGKTLVSKMVPLDTYKDMAEAELHIVRERIESLKGDMQLEAISGVFAMLAIVVGCVFGLATFVFSVLFFLALLDRLDALMKLHDITSCQNALIASQKQQIACMLKLVKSMDKSSESISAMDKHLCEGINWMGENLPVMLDAEVA